MTKNNSDVTILPDAISSAGAVSYWRLSGPTGLAELTRVWSINGLDPKLLPKPPGNEVAFGRAVREQAAKRRLVRPLERRNAWAVVEETCPTDGTLDYSTLLQARFLQGGPAFQRGDAGLGQFDAITQDIRVAYERQQGELSPEDISAWLVKLVDRNQAVSLRETGGIYFVPRPAMDFWRRAATVIEAVSAHHVFRIPAMKNTEVISAVVDAITIEVDKLAATLGEELGRTGDDALGERALETRMQACKGALAKVTAYEDLLGVPLTKIREVVETAQANVVTCALAAQSDEEAA